MECGRYNGGDRMNPDCSHYNPDKNFCNYFQKGNVPIAKVCNSCQYRMSMLPQKPEVDPCAKFRTSEDGWCYHAAAGIFRNNQVDGVVICVPGQRVVMG